MIGDEHLAIDSEYRYVWSNKVTKVMYAVSTLLSLITVSFIITGYSYIGLVFCALLFISELTTYGANCVAGMYKEANFHIVLTLVLIISMIMFIIKIN